MNKVLRTILTVLGSLGLLVYVGYQVYKTVYSPIVTETVYRYETYQTIDVEGITVRDETVIEADVDGYVYYLAENGTRVSKNGVIAQVFPSEKDAYAQTMIERLKQQIDSLKSIADQRNTSNANLTVINKQVKNIVQEAVAGLRGARYGDLYAIRNQLTNILNKQAILVGTATDFDDYIIDLEQTLNDYENDYAQATASIKSPVSGYFVAEVDGLEDVLAVDALDSLTTASIRDALKATPKPADGVGKVVGDYEWYMVCVVPGEEALAVSIGDAIDIRLPFASNQIIPMTVRSASKDASGDVALVLSCSYMSNELSSLRRETMQILVQKYAGLRIPKKALVFDEDNNPGVYVQIGNTIVLRKVKLLYSTSDFCICAEEKENKKDYLQLYDDIVVEGKELYDGKIVG